MFLLGTAATLWVRIPAAVPLGGAHSETIGVDQTSLGGTTTQYIRAIKRRWQLDLTIMDNATWALLTHLRETVRGPFWFYDGARPNLLDQDDRAMVGWRDASGTLLTPSTALRLTIPANSVTTPFGLTPATTAGLIATTPGAQLRVELTAAGSGTLQVGCRFYSAAGAFLSASSTGVTLAATEGRFSALVTAPANAAFAQPFLSNTTAGTTVTDMTVVPAPAVMGPAWYVVQIVDLTETHHNPWAHASQLQLREV